MRYFLKKNKQTRNISETAFISCLLLKCNDDAEKAMIMKENIINGMKIYNNGVQLCAKI